MVKAIEIENLSFRYPDGTAALDGLTLSVGAGEKVAILGALTPETAEISTPGPTIAFRDPVPWLTAETAALAAHSVSMQLASLSFTRLMTPPQ